MREYSIDEIDRIIAENETIRRCRIGGVWMKRNQANYNQQPDWLDRLRDKHDAVMRALRERPVAAHEL